MSENLRWNFSIQVSGGPTIAGNGGVSGDVDTYHKASVVIPANGSLEVELLTGAGGKVNLLVIQPAKASDKLTFAANGNDVPLDGPLVLIGSGAASLFGVVARSSSRTTPSKMRLCRYSPRATRRHERQAPNCVRQETQTLDASMGTLRDGVRKILSQAPPGPQDKIAQLRRSRSLIDATVRSPGVPLSESTRERMQPAVGLDLSKIRIHDDELAHESADAIDARAFAVAPHVVFAQNEFASDTRTDGRLLLHELAHVAQQRLHVEGANEFVVNPMLETAADQQAERGRVSMDEPAAGAAAHGALAHPAKPVLKYAAKWLGKRGTKTLTKHIARHARRIAGRAIHSVFRHPKNIKPMIEVAVREASEMVARNAKRVGTDVLEEGALRLARHTTGTPGKFRWVLQKTFANPIGTAGERVLRIIIDTSGRLVTAFPTDRLIAIGLGLGAVGILGERSADAADKARAHAERDAAREDRIDLWEFVPIIGDLWGGSLNDGEDDMLRQERELAKDIADTISAIENEENRSLGPEHRRVIEETFRAAVALPFLLEVGEEAVPDTP